MPRLVDPAEAHALFRAAELIPTVSFPGATKPWPAVHEPCGRVIAPTLTNVRRRGSACRDCAAERRGAARRASREQDAVSTMRAAGFTPLEPYPGSSKPWRSRHDPCGNEAAPRLDYVAQGGVACRTCVAATKGHRVWTKSAALVAFRAADLEPLVPFPGAARPWQAKHLPCGSIVSPRLANIAAGQGPCNVCARIAQAATSRNDHKAMASVMQRAGLEPLEPFPGVDHPWRCLHVACGREVSPSLTNVKRGQGGCPPCGFESLSARFRMPEDEARRRMNAADLEPLTPYVGSMQPWRSRHGACGRVVAPTLSNVTAGRGICRYCYSDFPFAGPAQLYLVTDGTAYKVGICAPGSDRLRQHRRWGWTVRWTIEASTGDEAWNVEQAVLRWWRDDLGAPPAYSPKEMPQLGSTETIRCDVVDEDSIIDFASSLLAAKDA